MGTLAGRVWILTGKPWHLSCRRCVLTLALTLTLPESALRPLAWGKGQQLPLGGAGGGWLRTHLGLELGPHVSQERLQAPNTCSMVPEDFTQNTNSKIKLSRISRQQAAAEHSIPHPQPFEVPFQVWGPVRCQGSWSG